MGTVRVCKRRQDTWGGEVAMDQVKPSPRVEALRRRYLDWKGQVGYETALYWTQGYQESEGEPVIIRRARALKTLMERKSLLIHPGELIVGGIDKRPHTTQMYPDMNVMWIADELDKFPTRKYDPLDIDEETKRIYREEILPYWKGRTFEEVWLQRAQLAAPDALKFGFRTCISDQGVVTFFTINHHLPDFKRVMEKGYSGMRKEVEQKIKALDPTKPDFYDKTIFYKALLIVCDGMLKIGKRFSALAKEMAKKEKDPLLKAEYLKIAEVCKRVPAEPAQNFHEALQSMYFTHFLSLNDAATIGFGRLDQYLYPWYNEDIETGEVTEEKAQELLDCFFIKLAELQQLFSEEEAKYVAGARGADMICVGGIDENGFDASNELSYMLLQAMCNVRLGQPSVSILWHAGMPEDLAIKAVQLASLGTGHPSIFNMNRIVEMLQEMGMPLKEARRGGILGCVEPSAESGKCMANTNFGYLNMGPLMEFALNQGVWRMNSELMGYPTPDPRNFTSFDEVMEAFRKQVEFAVAQHITLGQITEKLHVEMDPDPFADLLYEECVEKGKDIYTGGPKYTFGPSILFTGVADVINSLAAIKYLVFDKKKLQWNDLLDALASDFSGPRGEEIRQLCVKAPKFGNGDLYVDLIGRECMRYPGEETAKHRSHQGHAWRAAIIPLITIHPFGLVTGALPSGRKAGEPLAEGCSPKQGTDVNGPTAALMSVVTLDHSMFLDGTQLNMKFTPAALKDRKGLMNLLALIKTFISKGGYHIQFNVISKETLLAAQNKPEDFKGLTIRVSGYNTYFTTLCKEVQDEIIDRTEHLTIM
jgi:pyruvate formate-lyase/glycerol dehydratase family glycyl radical enzyme